MIRLLLVASSLALAGAAGVDFGTVPQCTATDTNPVICDAFNAMPCSKASIEMYCGTAWTKQTLKHCAHNRFAVSYSTQARAQAECDAKGAACTGVYDVSCNARGSYYLCKAGQALRTSSSSCVYKSQPASAIACCAANADCTDDSSARVKCSSATPPATWPKAALSHCASFKLPNEYHQSLRDAQAACYRYGPSTCAGVYDSSCDNRGTFYLCKKRAGPWSRSSSSCVYTPPAPPAPTPGPTTTAPVPAPPTYSSRIPAASCSAAPTYRPAAGAQYVCGGKNRYGCDANLIEAYCGTTSATNSANEKMLNACCGDVDGSCTDGSDAVYCKNAPTPAPPTPAPAVVTTPATLKGYTSATFHTVPAGWSVTPADAFRIAFAGKTSSPLGSVVLANVVDITIARRRLRDGRQLPAANGVSFDVVVTVRSNAAATALKNTISTTSNSDLLAEMSVVAGAALPASVAIAKTTPGAAVTLAPYYQPAAPASPTPAPGSYKPSKTVETLHKYMVKSGGVTEVWDAKRTSDGVVKVVTVAAGAGAAFVVLFLLWVFCHACCAHGPCKKRCYKKGLTQGHLGRHKIVQTLLFAIFGGLMFATIKGRASFHKAADIVAATLTDTSATFTTMETSAAEMTTQSGTFDAGFIKLTTCSATACDACVYAGQPAACGATASAKKTCWEKEARDALVGPNAEADGGYAKDMAGYLAQFRSGSAMLGTRLGGLPKQLRDISQKVGTDGKTYVDAVLIAMLVPGVFVLIFGLLGTWCLTKHTGKNKHCCSLSTLFLFFAQIAGVAYVIMLLVFIAVGAGSSVLFAEVCNQPVPETALIDVLQQDNMATGAPILKPEDFDVPTLEYYLTCTGSNQLEDQVRLASAGVSKMETELQKLDDCDTAGISSTVPAAARSVGAVQNAVGCPNINFLLLRFTRQGVCTHMVDGLYFLWTVQAACGVFLLLALTSMRLVMQTAHNADAKKPPAPTPVAANAKQIQMAQQSGSVQVFQRQGLQNTV